VIFFAQFAGHKTVYQAKKCGLQYLRYPLEAGNGGYGGLFVDNSLDIRKAKNYTKRAGLIFAVIFVGENGVLYKLRIVSHRAKRPRLGRRLKEIEEWKTGKVHQTDASTVEA
jgi:hypothetical protein